MATDWDYNEALEKVGALNEPAVDDDVEKPSQNTAQQSNAEQGQNGAAEEEKPQEIKVLPLVLEALLVGDTGFEPATSTMSTLRSNQLS